MSNKPEALAVKRALYDQGTTLRAWAKENGHPYSTVLNAVNRHAGGHSGEPWGQKTRAILHDLSRTINKQLIT